jgi:hypothetical protein
MSRGGRIIAFRRLVPAADIDPCKIWRGPTMPFLMGETASDPKSQGQFYPLKMRP